MAGTAHQEYPDTYAVGAGPLPNVIVAYSFTPDEVSGVLEHKVPPLCRRLAAMSQLQSAGWRIGLRFDPLIYHQDFREQYLRLFRQVFAVVDETRLHSVTLGPFRMPRDFHRIITRHYPAEPLFAGPMQETDGMVSYPAAMEEEMLRFCSEALLARIPETIFHTHTVAA